MVNSSFPSNQFPSLFVDSHFRFTSPQAWYQSTQETFNSYDWQTEKSNFSPSGASKNAGILVKAFFWDKTIAIVENRNDNLVASLRICELFDLEKRDDVANKAVSSRNLVIEKVDFYTLQDIINGYQRDERFYYESSGLFYTLIQCIKFIVSIFEGRFLLCLNKTIFFSRSHCMCDKNFYTCLKKANSNLGNAIGNIYLNIGQINCFQEDSNNSTIDTGRMVMFPPKPFTLVNPK